MVTLREVFKQNLIRIRGERSQQQMADFFTIDIRTYQRHEKEGALPNEANLKRMAELLGISEVELFQPENEEDSELRYILEILAAAHKSERRSILAAAKGVEKVILERTGGRKAGKLS